MSRVQVSGIADRLKAKENDPREANLTAEECEVICKLSRSSLLEEATVLDILAPVIIIGDIHGQFQDLLQIFKLHGEPNDNNKRKYVFLGDYVDRGNHSIETITLLLAYKYLFKDRIYLLRGNHETRMINSEYGFRQDIMDRGFDTSLWELYNHVFDCMPLCALVTGLDKKIFCTHGGISPILARKESMTILKRVKRPVDIPDYGVFCDLLWADPIRGVNGFENNNRGISVYFGNESVAQFCREHSVTLIARAHQVKDGGFEWFTHQLVTIFSAPSYAGNYENAGAILCVEPTGKNVIVQRK